MRTLLGCTLSLFFCCTLSAEEKIDPKKLVGKWCPKEEAVFTVEFTNDGKATLVTTAADGKVLEAQGRYKVDGNKVTVTVTACGKERTITRTVTKLTDTELVGTDDKGTERTLVRVKNK